jgi:hypothetical protein
MECAHTIPVFPMQFKSERINTSSAKCLVFLSASCSSRGLLRQIAHAFMTPVLASQRTDLTTQTGRRSEASSCVWSTYGTAFFSSHSWKTTRRERPCSVSQTRGNKATASLRQYAKETNVFGCAGSPSGPTIAINVCAFGMRVM